MNGYKVQKNLALRSNAMSYVLLSIYLLISKPNRHGQVAIIHAFPALGFNIGGASIRILLQDTVVTVVGST